MACPAARSRLTGERHDVVGHQCQIVPGEHGVSAVEVGECEDARRDPARSWLRPTGRPVRRCRRSHRREHAERLEFAAQRPGRVTIDEPIEPFGLRATLQFLPTRRTDGEFHVDGWTRSSTSQGVNAQDHEGRQILPEDIPGDLGEVAALPRTTDRQGPARRAGRRDRRRVMCRRGRPCSPGWRRRSSRPGRSGSGRRRTRRHATRRTVPRTRPGRVPGAGSRCSATLRSLMRACPSVTHRLPSWVRRRPLHAARWRSPTSGTPARSCRS